MNRGRTVVWFATPVALAMVLPAPAAAYFENALLSARSAALGGAFVAIADDASAVTDNAAGLTNIPRPAFLFSYQRPYGVDGLNEGYAAACMPAGPFSAGAGWYHRGLSNALGEDLFTLSVARDLKRTAEDASLSVGLSLEAARVSAQGDIDDSAHALGVGASVLLRPFAFIGLGYSIHSINQPQLDLVAGGPSTPLRRAQVVGLSYYWNERLTVTVETHQAADGVWRGRGGAELTVSSYLALRAGLEGSDASAGFGVTWKRVGFDAAMRTDDVLGASYIVSLRYQLTESGVPGALR